MINQIFQVATEFRFDIGHALLASNRLQESVNDISGAADNALFSFQKLGAGVVAHLGLGSGGLLTILGKAVQISDKFNNTALSFSNVISSNMKFLHGNIDTFNDRLETSKVIMGDITKVANQFALPSNELLNMTKLIAPVLIPHGAAGKNFSNAIDISKNVLKSAPNLGINPQDSEGQLIRAISGQAHMGDTLFRRLLSETGAFRDAKVGNAGQFNGMPFDKRLALLSKSLNQFSSDTDVLKNRVNSLSGQMTLLQNNFVEFGSVLRPIGDALLKPIIMVMQEVNRFVQHEGKAIAVSFGKLIENVFEDPKNLLINLLQFRKLGGDVKKGAGVFEIIGLITMMRHLQHFAPLAGIGTAVQSGLTFAARGLLSLAGMVPWLSVFSFVAKAAWFAFSRLLPPLAAAVAFFQIISRAKAIAQVNDAKNLLSLSPQLAEMMVRFKNALELIFYPITMMIDFWANLLAPLFEVTTWLSFAMGPLEQLANVLQFLGTVSVLAYAGLSGLFAGLFQFVGNLTSGKFANLFGGVSDAFDQGVKDVIEANASKLFGGGSPSVVNQVTNIGKVEIRNDFKEQQEPDRIAFTLKDQLLKAAKNPTQARGNSLQGAFTR